MLSSDDDETVFTDDDSWSESVPSTWSSFLSVLETLIFPTFLFRFGFDWLGFDVD